MSAVATGETPDPDGVAEAVRQLQAQVAQLRAAQAAHVCVCAHSFYPTAPQPYSAPFTVTSQYPVVNTMTTGYAAGGAGTQVQTLTFPGSPAW